MGERCLIAHCSFSRSHNWLIKQKKVEGRRTQNEDLRRQLYYRVQELLDEEQPYCFLYVPYALPVLSAKFKGIEPALAGISWNMDKWWVLEDQSEKGEPAMSPR